MEKSEKRQERDGDGAKHKLLNHDLQLTPQSEIVRLRKVIEEKDALIAKFKRYDEDRKTYYRRFEQNYAMMEERFAEFMDAINECDGLDEHTSEFYKEVVMRLYKSRVTKDKEKSILQTSYSKLTKLSTSIDDMEFVIMTVGNAQKKSELLNELRKLKTRASNLSSLFNQQIKELK